jgi:multicomponent Na+:H+ antiporter subunit G
MNTFLNALSAVLLVGGGLLTLAAAIGLLRFPDVLTRMHAATKPQVLGLLMVLAGVAILLRTNVDVWMLALAGGFQLLTAPIAAHLVGRLAYRTRHIRRDLLTLDDLERDDPGV